jgi:hypothetical protein
VEAKKANPEADTTVSEAEIDNHASKLYNLTKEEKKMYLMYVDESGDIGVQKRQTDYYILSALVVHENRWYESLEELIEFRKHLKLTKGLRLRDEIHSSHFINKPGELVKIPLHERVDILKQCIKWINERNYFSVFSVRIDKSDLNKSKEEIFENAWTYLIQRFENTLNHRNFNGPNYGDDKGLIITDKTDAPRLRTIYRKMRKFNPVPNTREIFADGGSRKLNIKMIIEDPIHRDSSHSYFIQLVDVIAYLCLQKYQSNKRAKSKGLHNYYKNLEDVIIKKVTNSNDYGIVEY